MNWQQLPMHNPAAMNPDQTKICVFTDLGTLEVPTVESLMTRAVELRLEKEIPDLLLFLSHPPTVALGLKDRCVQVPVDLLVSRAQLDREGILFTRSIRGGGITYHWPGQVVCYPVLALEPGERDAPAYMARLEDIGLKTLQEFGIQAERRRDAASYIGLWIGDKKLMSMGVRITNWVTSFGFALNLDGDHSRSCYVRPCGIDGACLTTMEEVLGQAPPRFQLIDSLKKNFASVFKCGLQAIPNAMIDRISGATQRPDNA
jgi:lipoate-protein ligase B